MWAIAFFFATFREDSAFLVLVVSEGLLKRSSARHSFEVQLAGSGLWLRLHRRGSNALFSGVLGYLARWSATPLLPELHPSPIISERQLRLFLDSNDPNAPLVSDLQIATTMAPQGLGSWYLCTRRNCGRGLYSAIGGSKEFAKRFALRC